MRKVRQIRDRYSEHFEESVFVFNTRFLLIVDNSESLDLPCWRLFRVFFAGLARCVDGLFKGHYFAVRSCSFCGGKSAAARQHNIETVDDAVAHVIGYFDAISGDRGSVRFAQSGVALRDDNACLLIIG